MAEFGHNSSPVFDFSILRGRKLSVYWTVVQQILKHTANSSKHARLASADQSQDNEKGQPS